MDIAIIGYGKMGRVIEQIALERGHQVPVKITSENANFSPSEIAGCDVAIEFSVPKAAVANMYKCFEANVPVVVGTTGWMDELETVSATCKSKNGGLFYASNFSVGVNIFFEVNKLLARLMNNQPSYEVSMEEIHHTQKLDSPSGTALSLAHQMINELERKTDWIEASTGQENEIAIEAKREPEVPGTHIITYQNEIDKIEIGHTAKGRKGFALGSVLAAEFMAKKSGVYTMSDLLKL
jgi:4-hydroxy-tetrahydrodipicolinate reductase